MLSVAFPLAWFCAILNEIQTVQSFAYAPNFITKIIADSTGKEPVGLLEVLETPIEENGKQDVDKKDLENLSGAGVPVCTRFPPEPNGYLHLGHAKAVSFNFAVARMFEPDGRCHMRLDDTNPSKEDQEYVDSILDDVRWIQSGTQPFKDAPVQELPENNGPWYGPVRKTSDYFDLIYDCAISLIKSGDAYVESLSAEEMREYRGSLTEPGKESPYRTRSIEENLEMFKKMKNGDYKDGEHILRAKIDMSSPNINMRDPALYRIKHESHPATGDQWCIYPMYDFSHPIADAVEEITHSLCTLEFEDHRPFYDWTLDKLIPTKLITARPQQIEFSRLNIKYTVLSKRKLIQLVEGKHVNGWDDPRMPTLSGMRRRGVPPAALRLFCERVGISKSDSNIDVGDLENCIREVMDENCKRAFAVLDPLKVTIKNWQGSTMEDFNVPRHPKKLDMGDRVVPFGKTIYIERSDFFDLEGPEGEANAGVKPKGFKRLLPNGNVRLKYAYVISCDEVVRDPETQEPIELLCTLFPETRAGATPEGSSRVKGIIQWVSAKAGVRCTINQYDRLFKVEEPGKDVDDFLKDLNPNSLNVLKNAIVEPSVAMDALSVISNNRVNKESDENDVMNPLEASYQFERNGYFALDPQSSGIDSLTFNRVVTLRDTWAVSNESKPDKRTNGSKPRNRGAQASSNVIEDVRRVAFRAGTVLEASQHPGASNLLVCKVDCGDEGGEARTVVAGLAGKISMESLVGLKIACVTNLKPAKMRGVESTAMLLAASKKDESDEVVELLRVSDDVPNGELFNFEGKDLSEPDPMMKSKGALKAFDRVKANLKANGNRDVIFLQGEEEFRLMTSKGPVRTQKLREVAIQ
mmetsp:Transcript_9611/g.13611  ORF Transcript_9611/g.13611 Transcript_9611/m.13611 type:complete len:864 (+) Transcript_9611:31-2622(+)|eukprot:CAMPEP_0184865810 /NCGR_PEP_ID=MMETSP0580-20130426/19160_1 /TAXON_ID=1118495 /ORGANISM="Dactyliosolen fragilissimus" /LENGTH=863 /DNA_ID=CAMNT_0027365139 /DNA_START=26 /DNA_END=2617 /DNA_ORIENTATION=-